VIRGSYFVHKNFGKVSRRRQLELEPFGTIIVGGLPVQFKRRLRLTKLMAPKPLPSEAKKKQPLKI
jgi:hypothetical protein